MRNLITQNIKFLRIVFLVFGIIFLLIPLIFIDRSFLSANAQIVDAEEELELPDGRRIKRILNRESYVERLLTGEEVVPDTVVPNPLGSPPQNKFGYSIFFNGESGHVQIPKIASVDLQQDLTLETWLKPTGHDKESGLFEFSNGLTSALSMRLVDGGVVLTNSKNNALKSSISCTQKVTFDEWNHIAATFSVKGISLFLNGKKCDEVNDKIELTKTFMGFFIGSASDQNGTRIYFSGFLDHISIVQKVLYETDFDAKPAFGGVTDASIIGRWEFDEQNANDLSFAAHNGEIAGKHYFSDDVPEKYLGAAEVVEPVSNSIAATIANFDNLSTNVYIGNAYPGVYFNDLGAGTSMFTWYYCSDSGPCNGQSLPNLAKARYNENSILVSFSQPSNVDSFRILAFDNPQNSYVGRIGLRQSGVWYYLNMYSPGWGEWLLVRPNSFQCGSVPCNQVTDIVVYDIRDYLGLGYDEFVYSPYESPTPTPPPCFSGEGDNRKLPACGTPVPTPTPGSENQKPNAPVVSVEGLGGEVKVSWTWQTTQNNPARVNGFVVQRASATNGPWTNLKVVTSFDSGVQNYDDAHNDHSDGIKIGTNLFYRVLATNDFGSGESNVGSAAPLNPCPAGTPAPIGSIPWTVYGWSGQADFRNGLHLANVALSGTSGVLPRILAPRLGFPALQIDRQGYSNFEEIRVDGFNPNESDETKIRLLEYDLNRVVPEGKVMLARYCVSNTSGRIQAEVTQEFLFQPSSEQNPGEPLGYWSVSKIFPRVTVKTKSWNDIDKPDQVGVVQRAHYRENNDILRNKATLFRDCDLSRWVPSPLSPYSCAGISFPIANFRDINKEIFPYPLWGYLGIFTGSRPPETFPENPSWDNVHQTSAPYVLPPGKLTVGRFAGCMSCFHSHWRWGTSIILTPNYFLHPITFNRIFAPGKWLSGQDYVEGHTDSVSKHSTAFLFSKFHPGESEISLGNNINAEILRDDNVVTRKPNGWFQKENGSDLVTWQFALDSDLEESGVVSGSGEKAVFTHEDVYYANGGFFANVVGHDRVVEPTWHAAPAYPVRIKSEWLYKDNVELDLIYREVSLPRQLPVGYTQRTTKAVEISYGRYYVSGYQKLRYKVSEGIPSDNLRVLEYRRDPIDGHEIGWADITDLGSFDGTSRTIDATTQSVAENGLFGSNSQIHVIAAWNPQTSDVSAVSDLVVSGATSPEPVRSGQNFTYNFSIQNVGTAVAQSVEATQKLDPDTDFVSVASSQGTCSILTNVVKNDASDPMCKTKNSSGELTLQSRKVICQIGDIPNGSNASVSVTVRTDPFGDGNGTDINKTLSSRFSAYSQSVEDVIDNNFVDVDSTLQPSLNKPPTIGITSPLADSYVVSSPSNPALITVGITASDSDGSVTSVSVVDNGTELGNATNLGNGQYQIQFSPQTYGDHRITVVATDNLGRIGLSSIGFTVNSTATVEIINPTLNAIVANGSSPVIKTRSSISGNRVSKVDLIDSNSMVVATLRQASNVGGIYEHQYTWNNIERGHYRLRARLTEISGATSTSQPLEFSSDHLPTVRLTLPTTGASYPSNTDINFKLQVDSSHGYINSVEYFANGDLINSSSENFQNGERDFKWMKPLDGVYSVVVVARNDIGNKVTSNIVNIGINRAAPSTGEQIWFDDSLPNGATGIGSWNWAKINPGALYGSASHQSFLRDGFQEHGFEGANIKLQLFEGDKLSAWVFIDPEYPPSELMLQWKDAVGWEHRAYWGQNLINSGIDGTVSRKRIGDLPPSGRWFQLQVPVEAVGLLGKPINGMKFSQVNGRVSWDRVGKILNNSTPVPSSADFVWIDDAPPSGSTLEAVHDTWTDGTWIPEHYHGKLSHRHWENDQNEPYRQHSFKNPTNGMMVEPGDTLFAYVYIPPAPHRPDTLVLQWYDDTDKWVHRAFWGNDSRPRIEQKISLDRALTNTEGWRFMGEVPASGQWVRLEVPASYIGLKGRYVKGMSFGIYQAGKNGRAHWDYAGKTSAAPTGWVNGLTAKSPLWRFSCGTGSSKRYLYSTNKNWGYYFSSCSSQSVSAFVYSYQAPGTIPLYAWESPDSKWLLNTCFDCIGGNFVNRGAVAFVLPDNSFSDSTTLKPYSCDSLYYYTTYPDLPDTVFPNSCTLLTASQPFVHKH